MMAHEMTRRAFCGSTIAAAVAVGSINPAQAAESKDAVNFYKNLSPGHLGVGANSQQTLDYAVKYGFAGIAPGEGEFENKSAAEIGQWLATMKDKGVQYGAAGLSVEFRGDDEKFRSDFAQYPRRAALLKQLGVARVATWILPGSNELTYLENFKRHETRLRDVAKVLQDNGIRLGLEFVGPRTSRERFRFPFACAQRDMMELVAAINLGNVGLLVDSWHWYTSHGTVEELTQLSNKDIVHVHVNDAPAGVKVDEQIDNRRGLPVTTGVIDMKGFINALVKIGYDGPVEVEPFDQELRTLKPDAAVQKTAEAINRVWNLIGV
ncbi:MAG: sugar phosphate isomerase/epimerase family protein [Solirubrobacterales bacterium]